MRWAFWIRILLAVSILMAAPFAATGEWLGALIMGLALPVGLAMHVALYVGCAYAVHFVSSSVGWLARRLMPGA
jgi:hypothetical protein